MPRLRATHANPWNVGHNKCTGFVAEQGACIRYLIYSCMCAALAVIRYMATDGYNQLGDLTPDGGLVNGNTYNRWNYSVGPLHHPPLLTLNPMSVQCSGVTYQ